MSVKRLAENRYLIDYKDGWNKRHRVKVWGSKRFAQELEAKYKVQAEEERNFPERRLANVTYRELSANYFKLHGAQLGSKAAEHIDKYVMKRFGNYTMKQLTSAVLQAFYNELIAKGLSAGTVNRYFKHISAVIGLSIKHNLYAGSNPCRAVTKKPGENKRTRYLSLEEWERLKATCSADIRPIVFCALYTGMRRTEILELEWDRVDLVNDNITLLKTKSKKRREIPLVPELKAMFLQLGPKESGRVFTISKTQLYEKFGKLLVQCSIEGMCFHSLRHSFASYYMMNGGKITDLQQILGHSSLALTQRYAHLSPEHLKKGMQVMNGVFGAYCKEQ